MGTTDELIKCIGVIANTTANEKRVLKISDIIYNINRCGFKTSDGNFYTKIDSFIRQAHDYYSEHDVETANNIKTYIETNAGEPVIKS